MIRQQVAVPQQAPHGFREGDLLLPLRGMDLHDRPFLHVEDHGQHTDRHHHGEKRDGGADAHADVLADEDRDAQIDGSVDRHHHIAAQHDDGVPLAAVAGHGGQQRVHGHVQDGIAQVRHQVCGAEPRDLDPVRRACRDVIQQDHRDRHHREAQPQPGNEPAGVHVLAQDAAVRRIEAVDDPAEKHIVHGVDRLDDQQDDCRHADVKTCHQQICRELHLQQHGFSHRSAEPHTVAQPFLQRRFPFGMAGSPCHGRSPLHIYVVLFSKAYTEGSRRQTCAVV